MRSITRPANVFETCQSPWRSCCERYRATPSGRDQEGEKHMPKSEQFEILVLGSGTGGKLIAWYMAQSGRRTAVVERRWVAAPVPTSPVCQARMRSRARESHTWRATAGTMAR